MTGPSPAPFSPTVYAASIMAAVSGMRGGVAFTVDPPTNVMVGTGVVVRPGGINLGLNHDNQIGIFNGTDYEWVDPILYWPLWLQDSDGAGTPGFLYFNGSAWVSALPAGYPPVGPAGGALTGTYPNPDLADGITRQFAAFTQPGEQGEQGEDGVPGIPGSVGPVGAIGLTGAPGQDGERGERGEDGMLGPAGSIGPPGLSGMPGTTGDQGEPGEIGIPGLIGPAGAQGPVGPDGQDGQDGPEGPMAAPTGFIPAGLIAMWSGTLVTIPTGWKLCDGTLGTPDLRSQFIKGAAAATNPGVTGGATLHTPAGTLGPPSATVNFSTLLGGTPAGSGTHVHTFTGTAANYEPAFFSLAFIMKT